MIARNLGHRPTPGRGRYAVQRPISFLRGLRPAHWRAYFSANRHVSLVIFPLTATIWNVMMRGYRAVRSGLHSAAITAACSWNPPESSGRIIFASLPGGVGMARWGWLTA